MPAFLDRYAWLLGDESAADRLLSSDLAALCEFGVAVWQVLPVFLPRVVRSAVPRNEDEAAQLQRLSAISTAATTLASIQMELAWRLTRQLEHRRVPYSLIKGAAARLFLYRIPQARGGLDIDVAVPSANLDEAVEACSALGFLPAALDSERHHYVMADPSKAAAVRESHYELATLARRQVIKGLPIHIVRDIEQAADLIFPWYITDDGTPACYVTVDIHHGIGLDVPVDTLVNTAHVANTGPYSAAVPSPAWMLFHLIFKIYWEGVHTYRRGAYQYADLIRLLPLLDSEDVANLRSLLEQYHLEAGAYYVLRRVEPSFDVTLNPGLRQLIEDATYPPQGLHPDAVNDAGDMWPKIWGRR